MGQSSACSEAVLLGRLDSAHRRQRCPASREPEPQSDTVFWERLQPALRSENEDLHLGFQEKKKKKDVKETNRMKWEQNVGKTQIALDLYLLDF